MINNNVRNYIYDNNDERKNNNYSYNHYHDNNNNGVMNNNNNPFNYIVGNRIFIDNNHY